MTGKNVQIVGVALGRTALTDEERANLDAQAEAARDCPPPPGQTGGYNSFWLDRGVPTSQVSLIVDPPDGRYPTRTDRVRESDAALNRAAALAALLLLAAGESAAQPQPFLERVEVARVVIDVRVVDDDGQPIPGLTPEDFEVRIDEEPVRVETALWVGSDEAEGAAVEAVRAADAADSPDPESPGARVGEIGQMLNTYYGLSPDPESPGARVGESRGRLIVFVVQNSTRLLQSRVYGLLRLLRKSEGLLAAVTPSDRVAVLSFGFHLQIWVDFTDNLDRVRTLLAGEVRTGRPPVLEPRGEISLLASLSQEEGREIFDIQEALRRIGEALEPLPGSKSVILIGHGFESDTDGYAAAQAALQAARASVFTLDVTQAFYHTFEHGLQAVSADTGGFFVRTFEKPPLWAMGLVTDAIAGHYVLFTERPALEPGEYPIVVDVAGVDGTVLARSTYVAR